MAAETASTRDPDHGVVRVIGRVLLGAFLLVAGTGHFVAPETFLAQVPPWMPARLLIVYVSGVVELVLGAALVLGYRRVAVGWIVAAFFVVILPGNISQAVTGTSAFGLDTPTERWLRLAFQPVLVVWALWSTGAWAARRR
ncbi:MAG: hypothetical protein ACLFV0_02865 [Nitriliruptoraceae bacterium]